MILRRLRLRNFRCFREVTLSFPEGLVAIVGPNGAGKSTIFEAVAWTLFGSAMSRTRDFGIAGRPGPCEAELVFEQDSTSHRMVRRLYGNGMWTNLTLFRDERPVARGSDEVGGALRRILPLEGMTFLRTHFSRQGELASLARDSPKRREALLAQLLGWDGLDRVLQLVDSDRKACPRGPAGDPEQCRARSEAASLELERVRSGLNAFETLEHRNAGIRAQLDLLEKERAELERQIRSLPESQVDGAILPSLRARRAAAEEDLRRVERRVCLVTESRGDRCPVCRGPLEKTVALALHRKEQHRLAQEMLTLQREERTLDEAFRRSERRRKFAERLALVRREIDLRGPVPTSDPERKRDWLGALERAAAEDALCRAQKAALEGTDPVRAEALERLQELLTRFRAALLSSSLAHLEAEASGVLATATGGRYSRVGIDRDFRVRMDGHILQRYSGGEQDIAALALRVGLTRLPASDHRPQFLALDEPFGGQDRDRRRSLVGALRRLKFRQVFVITHCEDVSELLPATIRVRCDGDGSAHIEEIS